ncbi:unnamed protein product [Brachionus calyciflorus]|uniref:Autocrine proliferation repressor A-like n=1 Tax=Brachionus calyciflorus TaxID=104777 RepID=A0A813VMF9_9BILA|nr:unnamed protein product [Brachionus calyciflorus]
MNLGIFLTISAIVQLINSTPLEDFVNNNDDLSIVKRTILNTTKTDRLTTLKYNFTSLKWFNESFSSSSIWWHYVYINIPTNLKPSSPIYFHIDNGDNNKDADGSNSLISLLASNCQCVTVTMRQIPNQPFRLKLDPNDGLKKEDDLIASSFYVYMNFKNKFPNSNNIPLLFPMTKAVKRGMDMVVEVLNEKNIEFLENFIVSGASKRGWVSYLTAAVDPRIFAVIPIVFDFVNLNANFHAQYRSLGGKYTFALKDYYDYELSKNIDTIEAYDLFKLVDVNMYLENLRDKIIYMIVGTGDEFMMPENLEHFIRNLKIQTNNVFVRVLDANHYLTGQEFSLILSIQGFLVLLSKGPSYFPKYDWKFSNSLTEGKIEGKISNLKAFESYEFNSYSARTANNKRIDFRKNTIKGPQQIKWVKNVLVKSSPITKTSLSRNVSVKISKSNYIGFYLESTLKFKGEKQYFVFSSNINIAPDTYPIGDCIGAECKGQLV